MDQNRETYRRKFPPKLYFLILIFLLLGGIIILTFNKSFQFTGSATPSEPLTAASPALQHSATNTPVPTWTSTSTPYPTSTTTYTQHPTPEVIFPEMAPNLSISVPTLIPTITATPFPFLPVVSEWLTYTYAGGVSIQYPAGWKITVWDWEEDATISIELPEAIGDSPFYTYRLYIYHRPPEHKSTADPHSWQPNEGGYEIQWEKSVVIDNSPGFVVVWGSFRINPDTNKREWDSTPTLNVNLYNEKYSLDVRLVKSLDRDTVLEFDPETFGSTAWKKYYVFEHMFNSIRFHKSPFKQPLTWQQIDFPILPPARAGGIFIEDWNNQRGLLFGGINQDGYLNDLWSTDGKAWEPVQSLISPQPRGGMSMANDFQRRQMVLFGGINKTQYLNDTWLLTGNEWQQAQSQTSPPARAGASMSYDEVCKCIVLFGGITRDSENSPDTHALNDMWTWDGSNWQQIFPEIVPPARFGASLVYDGERHVLLLFGGGAGGGMYNDTWVWDGVTWKEMHPLHQPPARVDFGMTFHSSLRKVILFGGQTLGGFGTDTWIWDGQDWTQLQTSQMPPAEMANGAQLVQLGYMATMLYNSIRIKTVISDNEFDVSEHSEVWILDRWP